MNLLNTVLAYYNDETIGLILEEQLIPYMKQFQIKRQDRSTYSSLLLASRLMREHAIEAPNLTVFSIHKKDVQDCIDACNSKILFDRLNEGYSSDFFVKRLRLNGNFSKEEMLHAAIVCTEATLVDLEYCCILDEECLEAVMLHLKKASKFLLKGTLIDESCEVIRKAKSDRKQSIDFIFADACKCCGARPGRVKEWKFMIPHKMSKRHHKRKKIS